MNTRLVAAALGAFLLASSAWADLRSLDGDQPPPPCQFRQRPCGGPHFTLAVETGVNAWNEGQPFAFGVGVGSSTSAGPDWGFRVGFEFTRWLAIDAHYVGMSNLAQRFVSTGGPIHLFTNAAIAEARFTLPLSYVQPYVFIGAGVYGTAIVGSDDARAATPMTRSTEFGLPVGIGVTVPVTDTFSVGTEITYHRLFGESLADDDEIGGGEPTTFNAVLRIRL